MYYYIGKEAGHLDVVPERKMTENEVNEMVANRFMALDNILSHAVDGVSRFVDTGILYVDGCDNKFAILVTDQDNITLSVTGTPDDYPGMECELLPNENGEEKWTVFVNIDVGTLERVLYMALAMCRKYGYKQSCFDDDNKCEGPEIDSWFGEFITDLRSLPFETQDCILKPFFWIRYPFELTNLEIRAAIVSKPEYIDSMRKALREEKNKIERARVNELDLIGQFHKKRPGVELRLTDETVEARYSWDPLHIGTNVNAKLQFRFFDESVNVSLTIKETVEDILQMFGAPVTPENILNAMRTNDWYLHMESTEKGITLIYHNYLNAYDFKDAFDMAMGLVSQFEIYLEDFRTRLYSNNLPPETPGYY